MQKTIEKKLRLSKETLRELVPQELGQVAGGARISCGATGCGCSGGGTTGFDTETFCYTCIPR